MIATKSVTIEVSCDDWGCESARTITAPTLAAANAKARQGGWRIGKRCGYQRVECARCASRFDRLVRAGILSKDGYVLDEAGYDAELASRS